MHQLYLINVYIIIVDTQLIKYMHGYLLFKTFLTHDTNPCVIIIEHFFLSRLQDLKKNEVFYIHL